MEHPQTTLHRRRLSFHPMPLLRAAAVVLVLGTAAFAVGCASRPGAELPRRGDEIVVCGRLFHTGAPVVLWTDPGGYDAYRTEKRFAPWEAAPWRPTASGDKPDGPTSPNRFSIRFAPGSDSGPLSKPDFERIRGGGWDLETLRRCVDQFVLHYDACGVARQCFKTLHDGRGLSIHFMLDLDGIIYQTLDVKDKAWHATTSNDRSVGVEIANIGAYAEGEHDPFAAWYTDSAGETPPLTTITIPPALGDGGIRTPGFAAHLPHTARPGPITGEVQGKRLRQYDFTPQQYDSLARLTAALCTALPGITCDSPRDSDGRLISRALDEASLRVYRGILGHYHIQTNKIDPGPAVQWDRIISDARAYMHDSRRAGDPVEWPMSP